MPMRRLRSGGLKSEKGKHRTRRKEPTSAKGARKTLIGSSFQHRQIRSHDHTGQRFTSNGRTIVQHFRYKYIAVILIKVLEDNGLRGNPLVYLQYIQFTYILPNTKISI